MLGSWFILCSVPTVSSQALHCTLVKLDLSSTVVPNLRESELQPFCIRVHNSSSSSLLTNCNSEAQSAHNTYLHLILDFGRKRKKKGRKNSLWESSERRKAKSKPDCCIRIEYRVPKDISTLESEGFDQEDIKSYAKRAHLRPRVISWMKDKGNDGPIRKLVHTVEKKSIGNHLLLS